MEQKTKLNNADLSGQIKKADWELNDLYCEYITVEEVEKNFRYKRDKQRVLLSKIIIKSQHLRSLMELQGENPVNIPLLSHL